MSSFACFIFIYFFIRPELPMCQALPTLRHWCVKRCFLHQPCPQARQALINHPLVTDVSSFISLASRACQASLSLPAWRHGYVKLCCFLPAWRHWHVRLCFLYQPGVTGMSSFALPRVCRWQVTLFCCCVFAHATLRVTGFMSRVC